MSVRTVLNVDLADRGAAPVVYAKQYDTDARQIEVRLFVGGQKYSPASGTAAVFRAQKPDRTGVFYDAQIDGNAVIFDLKQQVTAAAGNVVGEVTLFLGETRVSTFNMLIVVEQSPLTDEQIVSSNYYTALQGIVNTIMRSATVIKPLGSYGSVTQLQNAVQNPGVGDMYIVGTSAPYDFYFWTGSVWENAGTLSGAPGPKGETGAHFTPSVSADGVISWTNDGGLANPSPVNIRGPKGEQGNGLTIRGYYATLSALETAVPYPQIGDVYGVGATAPYDIYVYSGGGWVNNGPIQGAKGDPGEDGEPGKDGEPGAAGPNEITTGTKVGFNGVVKGYNGYAAPAEQGIDFAMPVTTAMSLPGSGTALSSNTIYPSTTVTNYAFVAPSGVGAWAHGVIVVGQNANITFTNSAGFVGGVPEFEAGKTYEFDVLNKIWAWSEVVSG